MTDRDASWWSLWLEPRTLRALHLAACVFGALPLMRYGVMRFEGELFEPFAPHTFGHVLGFMHPEKRLEMLGYALWCLSWPLLALIGARARWRETEGAYAWPWLIGAVVAAVLPWNNVKPPGVVAWAVFALTPIMPGVVACVTRVARRPHTLLLTQLALLVLLLAMLAPLVALPPFVPREYLGVDGHTLLEGDDRPDGTDDGEFLRRHPMLGLGVDAAAYPSMSARATPALAALLANRAALGGADLSLSIQHGTVQVTRRLAMDPLARKDPLAAMALASVRDLSGREVVYDREHQVLTLRTPICDDFGERLRACVDADDRPALDAMLATGQAAALARAFAPPPGMEPRTVPGWGPLNALEERFLAANHLELCNAMLARKVFHHHNFLLGAASEISLGRPLAEVNAQYGALTTTALARVLPALGAMSVHRYLLVLGVTLIGYYLLTLALMRSLLRDARLRLAFVACCTATIGAIGYYAFETAPGLSPLRHLVDMVVLWLVHRALRPSATRAEAHAAMAIAGVLTLLAVALNAQTGLPLLIGVGTTAAFDAIARGRLVAAIAAPAMLITAAVALAVLMPHPIDHLAPYYADGLLGFRTHQREIVPLVLTLAAAAGTWVRTRARQPRGTLLCLTVYTAGLFVYYVWGGTGYHFLNFAPVLAALLLYTAEVWRQDERGGSFTRDAVPTVLACGALILAVCGVTTYVGAGVPLVRDLRAHVVHRWTFPQCRIVTTMPEQPFRDAVELIRCHGDGPAIHLISQYDNVLPFLARRYSAMPYPDLQWFINSQTELDACVAALRRDRPTWLFVDNDLQRELAFDILSPYLPLVGSLHPESALRVDRLLRLRQVFDAVRGDYRPEQRGTLITAWRRIEASTTSPAP